RRNRNDVGAFLGLATPVDSRMLDLELPSGGSAREPCSSIAVSTFVQTSHCPWSFPCHHLFRSAVVATKVDTIVGGRTIRRRTVEFEGDSYTCRFSLPKLPGQAQTPAIMSVGEAHESRLGWVNFNGSRNDCCSECRCHGLIHRCWRPHSRLALCSNRSRDNYQ